MYFKRNGITHDLRNTIETGVNEAQKTHIMVSCFWLDGRWGQPVCELLTFPVLIEDKPSMFGIFLRFVTRRNLKILQYSWLMEWFPTTNVCKYMSVKTSWFL